MRRLRRPLPSTMSLFKPNPMTRQRLRRFWALRRARWSLWGMLLLYVLSLGAELICNSRPLFLRHEGKTYFPFCRFYPEDAFLHNGRMTRPDYLALEAAGAFKNARVLWAPLRNDPYRIVPTDEFQARLQERVRLTPLPQVAGLLLDRDLRLQRVVGLASLLPHGSPSPAALKGTLDDFWQCPEDLPKLLADRLAGKADGAHSIPLQPRQGLPLPMPSATLVFAPVRDNGEPRTYLRARLLPDSHASGRLAVRPHQWNFLQARELPQNDVRLYLQLDADERSRLAAERQTARHGDGTVESRIITVEGRQCLVTVELEPARYPFRPVKGHPFGLDSAGRDVLARILYGLRLALNFGLILVVLSLGFGSIAGILQGYLGGKADIVGQRLTEIWSALPFLYIMILMGSLYGTGFCLLIVCYALFNWIGISYYMRAETLRLRRMPYVEAARCLGLGGGRIALRHILPNALVPLITFFPFSLVGAIGSLAALDYLGFGVPPPAPSLGEMLSQAQSQPWAWWLILFPSLTLFVVMLAGVFIGEGVRNAFDPRRQTRLQ